MWRWCIERRRDSAKLQEQRRHSTCLSALFTLTSLISSLDLAVDTQGVDGETLDDGIHDTVVKCQRTVDPSLFNDLDVLISHFWQLAHPTATAGASCAKVSQLVLKTKISLIYTQCVVRVTLAALWT